MKQTLNTLRDGTIAQLVEQRTFNPFVVGSTPAGPTKTLVNIPFTTKAATNKWLFFFVRTDYALFSLFSCPFRTAQVSYQLAKLALNAV
jgi:hypothetical protein